MEKYVTGTRLFKIGVGSSSELELFEVVWLLLELEPLPGLLELLGAAPTVTVPHTADKLVTEPQVALRLML